MRSLDTEESNGGDVRIYKIAQDIVDAEDHQCRSPTAVCDVLSVLLHGSEAWRINKAMETKIDAFECTHIEDCSRYRGRRRSPMQCRGPTVDWSERIGPTIDDQRAQDRGPRPHHERPKIQTDEAGAERKSPRKTFTG